MKIIKIRDLDNCSDGAYIKSLLFDKVITKEFIDYLGRAGELQYFSSFARPFYQVNFKNKCVVKGVEGLKAARLKLYQNGAEDVLSYFRGVVGAYNNTPGNVVDIDMFNNNK